MNNIVIVGVLDKEGSTNISMAKAFLKYKNISVIPINYRTIIQNYGMQLFEDLLTETVKNHKPLLTIFCKCNGINSNIVLECNKYSKTWLYNPDPYQTIDQCPEVIEHMKNCTFCSHTGGGVNKYYVERYNLSNSYHIPCGLDYDLFKPTDIVPEYKAKISFIGNRTPERDKFKNLLSKYDTKFYGIGYKNSVINEEFSKVCSSSEKFSNK
ncbi:MAG: hypothetical protein ACTSPQ_21310 [Candidatus Helarchaeota archaeon]